MKISAYALSAAFVAAALLSGIEAAAAGTPAAPVIDPDLHVRDYTPEGFVRQPSFISSGGLLNKNEHAFIAYVDGMLMPAAIMAGWRWGLFYWWDLGVELGGDNGVFQAFFHTKIENFKIRKTERFFWANRFKTGFKKHHLEYTQDVLIDDLSWVLVIDNSLALRLGKSRRAVLYLDTVLYLDFDLRTPRRQTDVYIMPANIGFETMIGDYSNFYFEFGMGYCINGMETYVGVQYKGTWFPTFNLGIAYRTGDRTAIYYARETKHLAGFKGP